MHSTTIKVLSILSMLVFILVESLAQNPKIDSLQYLLKNQLPEDKRKVDLLNETALAYFKVNNDILLNYAEKGRVLANELNYLPGKAESLRLKAVYFSTHSDYNSVIEYYQKAFDIYEELGEKDYMAECLNFIGINSYFLSNYSEALNYYKKALDLFKEIEDETGIGSCYNNIGLIHSSRGDFDKSINNHQKALGIFIKTGYSKGVSSALNNIANNYSNYSNYPKALEYYQRALKIFEEIRDKQGISNCLYNIGSLHEGLGNISIARDYTEKAILIFEEIGDKKGIAMGLLDIGSIISQEQSDPIKALEYFYRSLKISEKLGDKDIVGTSLNLIGEVHQELGDYSHAIEYYQDAMRIKEEIGDKVGLCLFYKNMGSVYFAMRNYQDALINTIKSMTIADELELLEEQRDLYKQFSEIYAHTNNHQKAYENFVLFKEINDSIFSSESSNRITGLELQFKYDKENRERELNQQKQDAIRAEELKLQKTVSSAFIAGFILLSILVAYVIYSFSQKRKANRILVAQKMDIEKKNIALIETSEEIRIQSINLEATNDELETVNATKDKFFSIIAHDLRSPFNSLMGLTDILLENYESLTDDKRREMIKRLNDTSENTFKLLNNLLTWSRSQLGGIDFEPEKIHLKTAINDLLYFTKSIAEKKNINLLDTSKDNLFVYADRNMIDTVLRNLVTNAIKFTPKGGKILITAKRKSNGSAQEFVEIGIEDNGVGISPGIQNNLFRISESVSTIGTENEEGTGLGLILCKEFVEKHDGEIWVESIIGKGSKFMFTLKVEQ